MWATMLFELRSLAVDFRPEVFSARVAQSFFKTLAFVCLLAPSLVFLFVQLFICVLFVFRLVLCFRHFRLF